jgi:hypothetical protein
MLGSGVKACLQSAQVSEQRFHFVGAYLSSCWFARCMEMMGREKSADIKCRTGGFAC